MTSRRSGQVMIEYILMTVIIAGSIVGVMMGVIRPYMDKIQKNIADQTSAVVAQEKLGIPVAWFFGDPKKYEGIDSKLSGANNNFKPDTSKGGGPNGPGSGGPGNGGPGNGGGPNGGPNGKDAGSGLGKTADSRGAGSSNNALSAEEKKNKATKAGGKANAPLDDLDTKKTDEAKKDKKEDPKDPTAGPSDEEDTASGEALAQKKKAAAREEESRGGGSCRDMDLFTLVKLGALIAIVLLGGAVAVTTKGQKGSD
ncbi:MAG: hypothetical protein JST16_12430 [Bdellovibrionales bacterium]|nr:hypothetical protein [Bdellovibrionales bacterium]